MLRRWLDTPSISWEYDWMPMDCLLGGGCTQNISSFEKKKKTRKIHPHTPSDSVDRQTFRVSVRWLCTWRTAWMKNVSWFGAKKVNSKWQTQQKWIWSAARLLTWPFLLLPGWPSSPYDRETSPGFENTKSPQIHSKFPVLHRWPWVEQCGEHAKKHSFSLNHHPK